MQISMTPAGLCSGLLTIALLALAGCGGGDTAGEALGVSRRGPDEFAVVKRAPLIQPPDYNLRPPRPNDANAKRSTARDRAFATLTERDRAAGAGATGSVVDGASTVSTGEQALVSRANRAQQSVPEATSAPRVGRSLLARLLRHPGDETVPETEDAPVVVERRAESPLAASAEAAP